MTKVACFANGQYVGMSDDSGKCAKGAPKAAPAGQGGGQDVSSTPAAGVSKWGSDSVSMPRPLDQYPSTLGGGDLSYDNTHSYYDSKSAAVSGWYDHMPQWGGLFQSIAYSMSGSRGSARSTYEDFVQMAQGRKDERGNPVTPVQLAMEFANKNGIKIGGMGPGGGGGGGGGAAGPKPIDEAGIRRAMDSVSTSLIGRTLSDKEFKQYYHSYTKDFGGNPGLDYQQHETEAIKKEEDYQEMQVAQKFSKAFDSVLKGAM